MKASVPFIAWLLLLLTASTELAAVEPDRAARHLAVADAELAACNALRSVGSYKSFLECYPDHPRADHALYMLGEACRLATSQMIVPAAYLAEFNPELHRYGGVAHYLAQTYGMYADMSEGDYYWYYDMRAYRELLNRHPKSEYADDCQFLLVEPQQQRRAWAIGMGTHVAETARSLIARYEAILEEFPETNRRADIQRAIGELQVIEQRNTLPPRVRREQPAAVP